MFIESRLTFLRAAPAKVGKRAVERMGYIAVRVEQKKLFAAET